MLSNEKSFLIKLPKQQKNNRYYPRTNDIIINKPKQKFQEKVYSTNLTFLESAQSDTKQGSSVPQYAGSFSDSHASPFLFHFFLLFSISFILSRSLSLSSASLSFSLSLSFAILLSHSVFTDSRGSFTLLFVLSFKPLFTNFLSSFLFHCHLAMDSSDATCKVG